MIKRLIVNADDFGLSERTNEGILEAWANGIVTSSTLMVTMDAMEHAVSGLSGCNLDVGLHIDLSWGKSVALSGDIPTLAGANGKFLGKKQLLKKLILNRVDSRDVKKEISLQIKKFKETGLELFHLDVHQHFHGFPVVMKSIVEVAKQENIPFVRFVNELAVNKPVNIVVFLLFLISKRYVDCSFHQTDHFKGLALTDNLNEQSLTKTLKKIQPGLTEMMCHPGYNDPSIEGFSRLKSREAEIRALTSRSVKDTIASNDIELTTFRKEFRLISNLKPH